MARCVQVARVAIAGIAGSFPCKKRLKAIFAPETNTVFRMSFGNTGHRRLSRQIRDDRRLVLHRLARFEWLEDRRMLSVGMPQCEWPDMSSLPAEESLGASIAGAVPLANQIAETAGCAMQGGLPETDAKVIFSEPGGAWIPYTPTAGNASIQLTGDGDSQQASVDLMFSDAGFRVPAWGTVERHDATFIVNATIERSTGPALQVIISAEHVYSLGTLDTGEYVFEFRANGALVQSIGFTCSKSDPTPTHDAANGNHDLAGSAGAPLPSQQLGLMLGDAILVDYNAARFGRFIDSAPTGDMGLHLTETPGDLTDDQGIEAARRIDLLTVVMHESSPLVGHDEGGLMQPTLRPSNRLRLLEQRASVGADYADLLDNLSTHLAVRDAYFATLME